MKRTSRKTSQHYGQLCKLKPTPAHLRIHEDLPVSRTACQQAVEAMKLNPKGFSYQQWYVWYVQDEFGADLFDFELKNKPMSTDTVSQKVAMFPDSYPFSEENAVVIQRMPRMAFNPLFVPPASKPNEPPVSPLWTDTGCQDVPPYAVLQSVDKSPASFPRPQGACGNS